MRSGFAAHKYFIHSKFVFGALLALTLGLVDPSGVTFAKRKPAKHGVIKIQTTPAGLPIVLDGKPEGVTTAEFRSWNTPPGVHTIAINLPDGQIWTREINLDPGRIKCLSLNYRQGIPLIASPCPYPINLSAPTKVNEGELVTFTADVSYKGATPLNYIWKVNPGEAKIVSGMGTPTIAVDTTGLGTQTISATLVVDDGSGDGACRQVANSLTSVLRAELPHREAGEFDVCCSCTFDDQKARLDNLAIELQNEPSASAYVHAYSGRTSRVGEADRLGARAKDYLVLKRRVDAARIIVVNGGFREDNCVELWMVPSGAAAPLPRPTVQAGDARPIPESRTRRRRG